MKYVYSVCILLWSVLTVNAQYVDSIWEVHHTTTAIYSIPLFNNAHIHATQQNISQSTENAYTYSWVDDSVLEVIYTKPDDNSLWPALQFNTIHWEGDTSNRFIHDIYGNAVNHATASGYHVNMSKNTQRMVQFEIQCAEQIFILGALVDIEGKKSSETIVSIPATNGSVNISDDSKWQTITLAWDPEIKANGEWGNMHDNVSSSWWNRSNVGLRNASHAIDSSRIVGFYMFVNPSYFGTAQQEKTIYIRNVTIGAYDKNNHWQVCDMTENTDGIPVFASYSPFMQKDIPQGIQYTNTWENNVFEIDFTNTTFPNNTEAIRLDVSSKTGTTGNYFTTDFNGITIPHDTIIGTTVNLSKPEQRMIQFQVQANADVTIKANLIDINDKVSNRVSPQTTVLQTQGGVDLENNEKWVTVTLAWNTSIMADSSVQYIDDMYKTTWWNRNNENERNPIHTLDSSRIIGIELILDPQNTGSLHSHKKIYIRNVSIGNRTMFDVPDVAMSLEQQNITIPLMHDFYSGADIPLFSAQNSPNNNINVNIQNDILTITPKTMCENFTDSFVLEISDNSETYMQDISVTFTKHELSRPNLLLVTNDELGENMHIVWEHTEAPHIQYTNIYSNNLGAFNSIAHVPYSSESFYNIAHYTDNQTDNQFAISTVDICNQESELSAPHTALFLQIENADNNQMKLIWTPYIGADVSTYKIFAGNTPDNLTEITELTPDITTYIGEFDSYSILCVVAILTQKIESQNNTYDAIRSNYVTTHTKIASIQNAAYVFPNPCANYITLNAPNPIINIQLQTIQGVQIYCFESIEMPLYINTQNLIPGVYILKITYKNNTSEVVHFIKE